METVSRSRSSLLLALALPLLVALVLFALSGRSQGYAQQAAQQEVPPGQCPGDRMSTLGTGTFEGGRRVAWAVVNGEPMGGVFWTAGSRSYWHCHPTGQWLMIAEGVGRVQYRGERAYDLHVGDSHYAGPWVEHWHGAGLQSDGQYIQIAFQPTGTTWMEEVSNADYRGNDTGIASRNRWLETKVRESPDVEREATGSAGR